MKTCAAASEHIFCVSANVWLLLGVFQCFLRNEWMLLERYQCATASERKCAADIFLGVAASGNILMFFNECAAASKKILTTASERKTCATLS